MLNFRYIITVEDYCN